MNENDSLRGGGEALTCFLNRTFPPPLNLNRNPPAPRIWAAGEGGGLGIPVLSPYKGVWGYTIIPYVMEIFMLVGVWFGVWGYTRRRENMSVCNPSPGPLPGHTPSLPDPDPEVPPAGVQGPLFWPPWERWLCTLGGVLP